MTKFATQEVAISRPDLEAAIREAHDVYGLYMTGPQFQALMHIGATTAYNWRVSGIGPKPTQINTRWSYKTADVIAYREQLTHH